MAVIIATVSLSGCAPSTRKFVAQNDLDMTVQQGATFRHVIIRSPVRDQNSILNVYVGGDGSPWFWGTSPAADPTPRNPITLLLMTQDNMDSVFVGRPCYYGLTKDRGCNSDLWTFSRYSEDVVSSMVKVVQELAAGGHYEQVRIIGYSGGGTIARLMAPDVPNLSGILTIAANLDTDAWTRLHKYLPLNESENPANLPPLSSKIVHVQVLGGKDIVVPRSVTQAYVDKGNTLEVWTYPDFDHICCWVEEWPSVLARFSTRLQSDPKNLRSSQ